MTRLVPLLLLLLCLSGCATLRPILADCAAPAVKALVASNLDRGARALAGAPDAWDGAVGDLVAELGGAGSSIASATSRFSRTASTSRLTPRPIPPSLSIDLSRVSLPPPPKCTRARR